VPFSSTTRLPDQQSPLPSLLIASLLDAGAAAGTLRADVDPNDVLMALGGISLIAGAENQRQLATRLIDLLLHGVATTQAKTA
jgi:hypothetical protein